MEEDRVRKDQHNRPLPEEQDVEKLWQMKKVRLNCGRYETKEQNV